MNVEVLRLMIRGKFLTDKAFANSIEISTVELSMYLTKKKKMNLDIAKKMINSLNLSEKEVVSIFFN